ncbi:hydrogen peroxide-inducible genes activator [Leisingera aquaemixtae]|uniref:Morphology and auto-aggregation control protein n=1 Tax=Leisingera aquaemixtae TaxID=1396826 RepID=A0A0P1H8W7_9RHOB|nr:hydrogen peroxide-inducible genes activator [Leisingera aquaemixtae]CUH99595.1 Morphology and auto-aggregation control protein [Leisingera aquaemixtae]
MPEITLRQLRYFSVLSKALQYRNAARQLGISQPSLSLQIAALEKALDTRLIERRRSGLILTPAGRDTALQAEKILQDVERLSQTAGASGAQLEGTLRLGSSPTIGPYLLPRVLRRLHQSFPDLKLVIRDAPPRELTEDLLAGRHDLILTQLPVPRDDIRHTFLFREPLSLAVARDHPLAGQKRVKTADLAGENLLSLNPSYTLSRQVSHLSAASGANLREDFEGTSLDALRQMVSLGMGVTLLPALYVGSEVKRGEGDVAVIPMQPVLYRQAGLAWRRGSGSPPAFLKLADFIRSVAEQEFSDQVIL